jgi:hypothetical protein
MALGISDDQGLGELSSVGQGEQGVVEEETPRHPDTDLRIVLVAGMHRSGTSWLARTLNLCGADIGSRAGWGEPDNPHGFWEDRYVLALNEQILESYDSSWDHPPSSVNITLELTPAVKREILKGFTEDLILFKDPRISFTWPIFKNSFPSAELVAPIRHPMAVVRSLEKRNGFEPTYTLKLWERYNRCLVSFGAEFVEFPTGFGLDALVEDLGLEVTTEANMNFDEDAVHHEKENAPDHYQELYNHIIDGIRE